MFSVCAVPDPKLYEDCNTTAEVIFVLDSSSSVGERNFQIMREFTQNVSRNLKTEYEKLNVTVITFSNEARVCQTNFRTVLFVNEPCKLVVSKV